MPLRFPRPAMAGIALGLAASSIVLGSMPALAGSVRQQEWWLGKLDISQAWRASRGSGVTVAVLSDGMDARQSDLTGSVITGPDYTQSGRTAGGPYFGLAGTAIASLIAGHGHGKGRSAGIIGVAPDARILSVRVTLSPGDPLLSSPTIAARLPGAIAAGIRYAVRDGATVIDLPLDPAQSGAVGGQAATTAGGTGGSPAEKAAVAYALRKGVVLVAPAGDNGAGNDAVNYPAAYPGVISVGAFDQDFMKASYSSHQPYVTLTAAGAGVIAAGPGGYVTMSSTEAAGAMVAGMVALIRSKYPELTPAQVSQTLTSSTKIRPAGGRADGSGYGTADAAAAMNAASVLAVGVRRAGATAATRTDPAPPAAAAKSGSVAPQVLRAGVISAGILVFLLLIIAIYAAVQRRRARRAAAAAAERDRPAADRYAYAEADEPDPLLAFFSAPSANPARPAEERPAEAGPAEGRRLAAGHGRHPGSRPQSARSGHSAPNGADTASGSSGSSTASGTGRPGGPPGFTASGGRPGARDPFAAAGDPQGPGRYNVAGGHGSGPALGPAPRPARVQPKVSGAPPWEPAAKPDSELPWATAPAPHAAARMPRPAAPRPAGPRPAAAEVALDSAWSAAPAPPENSADSIWDSAARNAGGAGTQGRNADAGGDAGTGAAADPDTGQDLGGQPIYMWNPAAPTDTFPAVRPDRD